MGKLKRSSIRQLCPCVYDGVSVMTCWAVTLSLHVGEFLLGYYFLAFMVELVGWTVTEDSVK